MLSNINIKIWQIILKPVYYITFLPYIVIHLLVAKRWSNMKSEGSDYLIVLNNITVQMNYFWFDIIVLNPFECRSSRTCSPSGRPTFKRLTSFPLERKEVRTLFLSGPPSCLGIRHFYIYCWLCINAFVGQLLKSCNEYCYDVISWIDCKVW